MQHKMLKKTVSSWNGTVEWSHSMHSHFSHTVVEFTKVLTQVNVKLLNHSLTNWLHSTSKWLLGLWPFSVFVYLTYIPFGSYSGDFKCLLDFNKSTCESKCTLYFEKSCCYKTGKCNKCLMLEFRSVLLVTIIKYGLMN